MISIRRAAVHDLPGAYRVCLRTGDSGRDATGIYRDPDLLGHVYVGPYILRQPGTQLVLEDESGVAGYLLSADDTRAFEAWADAEWWPPLRERYPLRDGDTPDCGLVRLIHAPERSPDEVVRDYPAHLHIDLLERARGQGLGRALIEQLIADLRSRGIRGVHLDVAVDNANATAFYRHLGFEGLAPAPDSLMGMRLD